MSFRDSIEDRVNTTFIKFLLAGSLNTLFYYGLYALLIYLQFHYVNAVLFATIITMFVSFKTFGTFVFKKSDNRLLFKFILLTLLNYTLNIIIIYLLKEYNFNDYASGIIATTIVAIHSFILNKVFVFK